MIFRIKQTVSHRDHKARFEKESMIIGEDLAHAITMIKCSEDMKTDLRNKHVAEKTDLKGRVLKIEIVEEMKS